MKIYYDENIPYAEQFFSDFGQLTPFAGRAVSAQQVSDADVLLVRSITQVNQQLLADNHSLQFVGTATIGFDHVDRQYLAQRNVTFTNAPGCNAVSVAEYVLSAIMVMSERLPFILQDKTVGIVGAGNTGTALARKLAALGVEYKLCDPILEASGDPRMFSSLDEVCQCDIISLHVPKTHSGEHATFHMFDNERLQQLSKQQILINACRGEVIDNKALLALKSKQLAPYLVMDVWENEPNILEELMPYCDIATPHIAGYSLEGKARGTEMLYQALAQTLGRPTNKRLIDFLPKADMALPNMASIHLPDQLRETIFAVYDVRRDDQIMRSQLASRGFDWLRKNYPERRELSALSLPQSYHQITAIYRQLGFA
ncbi:4-phosphoerythronate dehydrogenase [Thalassotalea maritima]|uniref:4-phosphoerythronate dehydrogenase n=1 Tax=Thalassotalea maritima TaxID=3242416 RepID=UPI00352971D3